ncbi:MAG: hypothetical protein WCI41_03365 [bacterium]
METNQKPKVLKWALVIGIVIVLNLFFNYSISLFYKEPDYNNYFKQAQVVEPITTKEACLKVGGQWNENGPAYYSAPAGTSPDVKSYCDPNFTKQQEFNQAQKVYNRNIFIVLVLLGVFSFLLGIFIANEIITLSFSWGGVLSFIIASMRYWSDADSWVKVLILALALSALIWLAIKKFGNNQ